MLSDQINGCLTDFKTRNRSRYHFQVRERTAHPFVALTTEGELGHFQSTCEVDNGHSGCLFPAVGLPPLQGTTVVLESPEFLDGKPGPALAGSPKGILLHSRPGTERCDRATLTFPQWESSALLRLCPQTPGCPCWGIPLRSACVPREGSRLSRTASSLGSSVPTACWMEFVHSIPVSCRSATSVRNVVCEEYRQILVAFGEDRSLSEWVPFQSETR